MGAQQSYHHHHRHHHRHDEDDGDGGGGKNNTATTATTRTKHAMAAILHHVASLPNVGGWGGDGTGTGSPRVLRPQQQQEKNRQTTQPHQQQSSTPTLKQVNKWQNYSREKLIKNYAHLKKIHLSKQKFVINKFYYLVYKNLSLRNGKINSEVVDSN
jgi:hypothetical protein